MRDGILALVCALALVTAGVGLAAGTQSTPTVSVDAPNEVGGGSTASASLVVSDVADPDGVGSFTVNVSYDPSVVSVTASGTGTFDIQTSTPAPGVLRIVGYTGEYPGPNGTVTLAALQVSGDAEGSSALDSTVETLSDADGDSLAATTSSESITVTSGGSSSPGGDDGTDDTSGGTDDTSGSAGGTTGTASGAANVSVTSASLSTSEVAVGESVTVSATAENTGDADGSVDLPLVVDGSETGTSRLLEVPAGETRTESVTTTFDAPGEYEVAFGGVTAGTVTVTDGGPAPTASPTPSATPAPETATATTSPTASATPTDSPTEQTPSGAAQPGFGVLAVLLAALVAAGLATRR